MDRKYMITYLLECQNCYLHYSHPVENEKINYHFYQKKYTQLYNITTDIPFKNKLDIWLSNNFSESYKNAQLHNEIIKVLLDQLQDKIILDYGAKLGSQITIV